MSEKPPRPQMFYTEMRSLFLHTKHMSGTLNVTAIGQRIVLSAHYEKEFADDSPKRIIVRRSTPFGRIPL